MVGWVLWLAGRKWLLGMNDWLLVAVCVSGGVARDGKISDSLLVPEIEIVAGMDQVEDNVEDYNL